MYSHRKTSCSNEQEVFIEIVKLKLLFVVFALLVSNAARSLACGLARSLAFAAAALNSALVQVASFDGLDSAHVESLIFPKIVTTYYIAHN